MSDLSDDDQKLREGLAVLPAEVRTDLERVLNWPPAKRDRLVQQMTARPDLEHVATLVAIASTDEIIRLRLLRALRAVAPDA